MQATFFFALSLPKHSPPSSRLTPHGCLGLRCLTCKSPVTAEAESELPVWGVALCLGSAQEAEEEEEDGTAAYGGGGRLIWRSCQDGAARTGTSGCKLGQRCPALCNVALLMLFSISRHSIVSCQQG